MNRKQKLLLDTGSGLLKQVVALVCGFILPRYMLLYFGSDVNGLVSSITHFLSFISLLEMGIGPVVQASLYGPLANRDQDQVSRVVISAERFFRRIAYIFLIYIVVLSVIFPTFINTDYDAWFTISLLVIIAISTIAQYLFGATYQLLLNADQKAYVQNTLSMVAIILNTVISVVLMQLGASIHIVKLFSATIFILRPLGQAWYVRRHYSLNKKLKLVGEPIKQKWNGFAQHLSAVVCSNVAVILLTFFSSLSNVSIYSVYFLVVNGITTIIMAAATGLESYFGGMIAKKEQKELNRSFQTIELLIHMGVTLIFTISAIMITPFISVYTSGITDADYIQPIFGILLVAAYAAQCLRVPYFRIIKAAGHFKETQNGSFISTALNVLISLALVFQFDLIGIAIGTLVAMLYHTCYFVFYLRKNILNRSVAKFAIYLLSDIAIAILTFFLTKGVSLSGLTYGAFIVMALQVSLVTVSLTAVVYALVNIRFVVKIIREKILKRTSYENK